MSVLHVAEIQWPIASVIFTDCIKFLFWQMKWLIDRWRFDSSTNTESLDSFKIARH